MKTLVVIVLLVGLTTAAPGKLPEGYTRCSRSDPKLGECLKASMQGSMHLVFNEKGDPRLGVYGLDPIKIDALDVGENEKSSVNVNLKFRNISLSGLGKMKLLSVEPDLDNYKMTMKMMVPSDTIFASKYEMNGKVLILPIRGKGDCKIIMEKLTATFSISGKEKKKQGQSYWDVKEGQLKYDDDKLRVHFDGLFSDDGQKAQGQAGAIGDAMNKFLNENWKEIQAEVKPAFELALSTVFKEMAARVFSRIPMDEIFLP